MSIGSLIVGSFKEGRRRKAVISGGGNLAGSLMGVCENSVILGTLDEEGEDERQQQQHEGPSKMLSLLYPEMKSLFVALGFLTVATSATMQFPHAIGQIIDIISLSSLSFSSAEVMDAMIDASAAPADSADGGGGVVVVNHMDRTTIISSTTESSIPPSSNNDLFTQQQQLG